MTKLGISDAQRGEGAQQLGRVRKEWQLKRADWEQLVRPLSALAKALDADDSGEFDEVLGWLETCGPRWIDGRLPDAADEEVPAPPEIVHVLAPLQERLTDPPAASRPGDGSSAS
ncbi:CATRA system-associated protein [Streptomyces erythrochromogenes]|uniref:CATRA system-associated protein n=1 Tax=Streptomyces erythrochromogenes TaxID=285574 RepID=UPI003676A3C3